MPAQRHGRRRWKKPARSPTASAIPLLVRPSYVLGGRGMDDRLRRRGARATTWPQAGRRDARPSRAHLTSSWKTPLECDVDAAVRRRGRVRRRGVMEHIEMAGIHSGDSACVPASLSRCSPRPSTRWRAPARMIALAKELRVRRPDEHPVRGEGRGRATSSRRTRGRAARRRSSRRPRACPFQRSSRAASWRGRSLAALKLPEHFAKPGRYFVKEAVMPFGRFPGADALLGPEMRSTGEVMGIAGKFPRRPIRRPRWPSTTPSLRAAWPSSP